MNDGIRIHLLAISGLGCVLAALCVSVFVRTKHIGNLHQLRSHAFTPYAHLEGIWVIALALIGGGLMLETGNYADHVGLHGFSEALRGPNWDRFLFISGVSSAANWRKADNLSPQDSRVIYDAVWDQLSFALTPHVAGGGYRSPAISYTVRNQMLVFQSKYRKILPAMERLAVRYPYWTDAIRTLEAPPPN